MPHPRDHLGLIAGGRFRIMQEVRRPASVPPGTPHSYDDACEPTGVYSFWFLCPGCQQGHKIDTAPDGGVSGRPIWSWNGDLDAPTFAPSLLVRWTEGEQHVARICHSFVQGGRIQFLSDCSHALAGQTVDLPQLPDWLRS